MNEVIKVLSVKQPWPYLMFMNIPVGNSYDCKDVENRTWKTKHRGRVYIHVSGTPMGKKKYEQWRRDIYYTYCVVLPTHNHSYRGRKGDPLPYGMIIGHVNLDSITEESDSRWFMGSEIDGKKNYAWNISNPTLLLAPIETKGKLGIWNHEKTT